MERLVARIITLEILQLRRVECRDLALGGLDAVFLQRVRREEGLDAER
jgi:hypothetical protein